MTSCKTTKDLNQHINELEAQDELESKTEDLANEYYQTLIKGNFIKIDGKLIHFEDIVSEIEIDPYLLTKCAQGDGELLQDFILERLNEKTLELAKLQIKKPI